MVGSHPNGWSWIGNFLLWCTRVRTTAVRRPDDHIWIAILALRVRASERDTTSSGRLIDLPFLGTWKEIRNWSSTGRCPDVMMKRLDGCKLAQKLLDTVWGPDGMNTWSGRMMLVCLASGRYDTLSGRDGSIVRTADRELWISSNLQTLNSGIPVYSIFTLKWFCPNIEWGQNTNSPDLSASCPDVHQWSISFRFFPSSDMGRLIHHPDDVVSRLDALIHKARIAIQISL
jgi:hypothetical protein